MNQQEAEKLYAALPDTIDVAYGIKSTKKSFSLKKNECVLHYSIAVKPSIKRVSNEEVLAVEVKTAVTNVHRVTAFIREAVVFCLDGVVDRAALPTTR